jgi:hypothetical protein
VFEWTDWFSNGKLKAGYDSKLWFSHEFGDCVHPAHDVEFRKPETPEAKQEREELEAAYSLYLEWLKLLGHESARRISTFKEDNNYAIFRFFIAKQKNLL